MHKLESRFQPCGQGIVIDKETYPNIPYLGDHVLERAGSGGGGGL